jgi:glutathione S-transferase
MITIYAFGWVPPQVRGLVRDLRVRWALEEAGIPYRVELVSLEGGRPGEVARDAYHAVQPFGQIPAMVDGDLTLFESGAIVHYIAERSGALLPAAGRERTLVIQWMFAALNTLEPPIQQLASIDLGNADQAWAKERRPAIEQWSRTRLAQLAACLEGREHLVEGFSAADLLMSTVLRMLRHTTLLEEQPVVAEYYRRCEARPAFEKALQGQMAAFGD